MKKKEILNIEKTNQNYRKILVNSTINIMESNQYEYSKQTNIYIPESYTEKPRNFKIKK
jgi:hypothetical protein